MGCLKMTKRWIPNIKSQKPVHVSLSIKINEKSIPNHNLYIISVKNAYTHNLNNVILHINGKVKPMIPKLWDIKDQNMFTKIEMIKSRSQFNYYFTTPKSQKMPLKAILMHEKFRILSDI